MIPPMIPDPDTFGGGGRKPLAIDLFCGLAHPNLLAEAKLFPRANAEVEEFMACWAEHPDHMSLSVRSETPRPPALKAWLVGKFKDAALSARLARGRKIGVLPTQTRDSGIAIRTARVVDLLRLWFAKMKCPALFSGPFASAVLRAIAPVRVWRCDVEVPFTPQAIPTALRDVGLLTSPAATGSARAWSRAIALVRALCDELSTAFVTEKIVHERAIT